MAKPSKDGASAEGLERRDAQGWGSENGWGLGEKRGSGALAGLVSMQLRIQVRGWLETSL